MTFTQYQPPEISLNSGAKEFFARSYPTLRPGKTPFPWMGELFARILQGCPPRMVDLPTGSGKTDLAVVWLIALAYYGTERSAAKPVPRRLIWVVNRQVLVGQIYRLAQELQKTISKSLDAELLRKGLAKLCTNTDADEPFKIVQLRGQVINDREWSFSPSCPTLIIGTVDQIGSRLLFQGYGLGKRERPLQAGLFGVDAWVCVDEAHLVPAFILMLRQISEKITNPPAAPFELSKLFALTPWYFSELSATPGLPAPSAEQSLQILPADELNKLLAMRIAAGKAKRVNFVDTEEKDIISKIVNAALKLKDEQKRVAIYVYTPKIATEIGKAIENGLKTSKGARKSDRILTITGRMRGVEREELNTNKVYNSLATDSRKSSPSDPSGLGRPELTVYLIGTSAAEVGVDTDADVILCDFAPMDTLLQRLGRLDRLGALTAAGETPTIHVFGSMKENSKLKNATQVISQKLANESYQPSATLIAANSWNQEHNAEEITKDATLRIIREEVDSSKWRYHSLASATVSSTLCQPLTDAILSHWTATSLRPNQYLPVDPWLYGFGENTSTPLVGIIFRRELDALVGHVDNEQEDPDADPNDFTKISSNITDIFRRFPPAKSEAHWLPIYVVRDWLLGKLEKNKTERSFFGPPSLLFFRDEGEWSILTDSENDGDQREALAKNLFNESVLILPTLADLPKPIADGLTNSDLQLDQEDVADRAWGSSDGMPAKWLRKTNSTVLSPKGFVEKKPFLVTYKDVIKDNKVVVAAHTITLRYFLPESTSKRQKQFLNDHQNAAQAYASELARSLLPSSGFFPEFFGILGLVHDEGKASSLWQNAIDNRSPKPPLAKTTKVIPPRKFQGYRHEWGSLTAMATEDSWKKLSLMLPESERTFFHELFLHLIGSHHGHLRPSLPDQPNYQPTLLDAKRCETALRWHRLQTMLGPWRLAYLETLLKAADTLASKDHSEIVNPTED
jgi:CRISPR-associated endonuclease/helicase Cas3